MSTQNRNTEFISRSLSAVWHPCTQMKHHEHVPLVPIVKGEGAWLIDANGNRYLDAVSSWWVNLFGHTNPRINAALKDQLDRLEHTMLAGFTHEPVIELSERLGKLTGLGHAFYGSDGASAAEIALKMSFHFWRNAGQSAKQKFVCLQGGYHGETIGALAVTDVAIFRDAYGPLLNNNLLIPSPADGIDESAAALEKLLDTRHNEIAALIVEPLVQGASGMRMYDAAWLARARALCTRYSVHLIADEIMTGFGRTGTMFACEQANVKPDFMCLSKGLTGGYLPLSCVLATDDIYAAFYDDDTARGFLHSHSYTGSALACRAALATLDIFVSDKTVGTNVTLAKKFSPHANAICAHPRVKNFRHLGMIWAFDIASDKPAFAREFFSAALKHGVLLRPIGKTVYFMPPYVVKEDEFAWLVKQTIATIDTVIAA